MTERMNETDKKKCKVDYSLDHTKYRGTTAQIEVDQKSRGRKSEFRGGRTDRNTETQKISDDVMAND